MDTRAPVNLLSPSRWEIASRLTPRGRLVGGIVIALLVVVAAWRFFGGGTSKPQSPPPPVHVGVARLENMDVVEHTIGTVLAQTTVNVTPQVSGQLIAANFTEGQIVHQGDLLFQIDPRPFQAALDEASAALAKDQANLANAKNDEHRFVALYAQNAASQEQRDQAVATAKADAALVQSDKAAIDLAKLNLGYTQIKSPITGKTGPIEIYPGNVVTASSASTSSMPLVTITQIQPIKVSFFLPQNDLPQIQNQMLARRLIAVIPMQGAKGGAETAPVDFVGNAVSAQSGTIELRATYANDDFRLVPGQMVSVGVTLHNLKNVIVVPRDAVNSGPDNNYVFALDAQDKVSSVPVTILNDDGTNDAIAGNIKPGTRVITEGQLRVVPGIQVEISKKPSTAFAAPVEPGAQ